MKKLNKKHNFFKFSKIFREKRKIENEENEGKNNQGKSVKSSRNYWKTTGKLFVKKSKKVKNCVFIFGDYNTEFYRKIVGKEL